MEIDLGRAFDALPAMMWTARPDGYVDFVNRRWSEYTGLPLDSAQRCNWQASVNPDDLPGLNERWRSILATGESGEMEARVRRADGQFRWLLIQCNPMRDETGIVVKWHAVSTDVDDIRRAEVSLREGEQRSRLIVDGIPGLVAVFTPKGEVEFVNRQVIEYFGMSLDGLKRWEAGATTHPDDLPRAVEIFRKAIASGESFDFEVRARRFDGVYRWFQSRGHPVRDATGNIVRWYNLLIDVEDRKRADEALQIKERELELIINTIPTMAWSARPDGSPVFFNQHYLHYVGLSIGQSKDWVPAVALSEYWDLTASVHPDDVDGLTAAWEAMLASGKPGEAEARLRRFDGIYRWFLVRANPLRNEAGDIVKWYGVSIDIDDRKRAEEALRESERTFKLTIDTIPALAWSAHADGSAEYLNQRYLDYVGLTAEEAQGWGWTAAVHPDDLAGLTATWQAIIASGKQGEAEARLRRFDGEYRWLLFRASPFRGAWYGVNTDIDDRKRAETRLRRSEAFLAEGQHLARMGNFSWHVTTGDITWSEPLYRIFEFEPGVHMTLELIASRVHPEDLHLLGDMVERATRGESDFEYQHRILLPDNSVKYLHLIAHRSRGDPGQMEYIGAVLDVTQRRLADEALSKARSDLAHVTRISSLGALTASIAHEVNQPLAGIITNASTCLRMLAADPPDLGIARETARRTIRDGNRAADVIARLRALFSKRTASFEPLDLNEAAREVIALSGGDLQRNGVVVRTELADSLPLVAGDRVQLQQVAMNLVRNAADAMNAVDDRARQLLIRTEQEEDDHVRLSVRDTGIGFGPDGIERLFEIFYTTKSDGMGIGLSVSRSIIESHRGRLWAQANDGPGVTFSFSIPRYVAYEGLHEPINSNAQNSAVIS